MIKRIFFALSLVFATALPVAGAYAQDGVTFDSDAMVVRSVEENGVTKETLEAPTSVIPGDRIVFRTRYHNGGSQPAKDLVISNPLPDAVMLAEAGDFDVSVDGGATFGKLADLTVKAADGTSRPAELADVTNIRWILAEVDPGQSGEVKFFAVVR